MQCIDGVVAQAARVAVVAAERMEAAGAAFEQIQAAAGRANPKIAEPILGDGAGARTAERVVAGAARIASELAGRLIDAREAAAERSDP